MHHLIRLILLSCLLAFPHLTAAPADAQRIQKSYQLALEKWASETRAAATPTEQTKAWNSRPDPVTFAKQMWAAIGQSLDQEWTLEPSAWFLQLTPSLLANNEAGVPTAIFTRENEAIRKTLETHHLNSLKLIPVCVALASSSDPRSLSLLEKIQSSNPDTKTQGVAALGAAMQLKALGDDGEIMRKRLTLLRKAIIQSSDVELGGVSVAKLAGDELYIIRFLSKGRVAPDLVGKDSALRPLSLSENKGKVIILLFWNSDLADARRVIEITAATEAKFKGRPLIVIGVNNDPVAKLRSLQADSTVTWTNFSDPENKLAEEYRVGSWPLAYVLDGERKIHYAGAPGSFVELTAEALLAEAKPAAE